MITAIKIIDVVETDVIGSSPISLLNMKGLAQSVERRKNHKSRLV